MHGAPFLIFDGLDKSFGAQRVLSGLSLDVGDGELLALLGPSGSGKTTALRLLAGFESPDRGTIRVAGEDVTGLPPARRGFGMVFQHYALFPHLSVGQNVAFGLETRGWDDARIRRRVAEVLALADLPGFENRRPAQLSGGQQQRVALARALAPEPRLLLLDEPLSNLDPTLRERTRSELRRAVSAVGITTILVTHEQEEAFHLGDRVAVLEGGVLQQVGLPEDLYARPASRFVATFIGRASIFPGRLVAREGDRGWVEVGGGAVSAWSGRLVSPVETGAVVELVARPEALALTTPGAPGSLAGEVVERRFAGVVTIYRIALERGLTAAIEVIGGADTARPGVVVGVAQRQGALEPVIFPHEASP